MLSPSRSPIAAPLKMPLLMCMLGVDAQSLCNLGHSLHGGPSGTVKDALQVGFWAEKSFQLQGMVLTVKDLGGRLGQSPTSNPTKRLMVVPRSALGSVHCQQLYGIHQGPGCQIALMGHCRGCCACLP